jgi:hypothetical protein
LNASTPDGSHHQRNELDHHKEIWRNNMHFSDQIRQKVKMRDILAITTQAKERSK